MTSEEWIADERVASGKYPDVHQYKCYAHLILRAARSELTTVEVIFSAILLRTQEGFDDDRVPKHEGGRPPIYDAMACCA